jgi:hypothetical protein
VAGGRREGRGRSVTTWEERAARGVRPAAHPPGHDARPSVAPRLSAPAGRSSLGRRARQCGPPAGEERRAQAQVAFVADDAHPRQDPGQAPRRFRRVVRAAVIDHDDPRGGADRPCQAAQAPLARSRRGGRWRRCPPRRRPLLQAPISSHDAPAATPVQPAPPFASAASCGGGGPTTTPAPHAAAAAPTAAPAAAAMSATAEAAAAASPSSTPGAAAMPSAPAPAASAPAASV